MQSQKLAIDGNFLAPFDLVSRFRHLAVDADAPLLQQGIDLATRTVPLAGEVFLYSFHSSIIPDRVARAAQHLLEVSGVNVSSGLTAETGAQLAAASVLASKGNSG